LAKDAAAHVDIFDLQGRLVNTIFDGHAKTGSNEAIWDGRDGAGANVANGVYFYRFRALDQDQTRKLVIVGRRN
jgi:flagellar hook assembly protein FlgD